MPANNELETILGDLATGANAVLEAIGKTEAAALVSEIGRLATLGISAYQAAMGTPITPESILQLLPDQTALKPSAPAK